MSYTNLENDGLATLGVSVPHDDITAADDIPAGTRLVALFNVGGLDLKGLLDRLSNSKIQRRAGAVSTLHLLLSGVSSSSNVLDPHDWSCTVKKGRSALDAFPSSFEYLRKENFWLRCSFGHNTLTGLSHYYEVSKTGGTRTILHTHEANQRFRIERVPFLRVALCARLEFLDTIRRFGPCFFYYTDFVNFYHQIPVGDLLSRAFCSFHPGPGPSRGKWKCSVLPQGWSGSCGVANNLSWATVAVACCLNDIDISSHSPHIHFMKKGTNVIGFVVVLYDNIVFAFKKASDRNWAMKRFITITDSLAARRKYDFPSLDYQGRWTKEGPSSCTDSLKDIKFSTIDDQRLVQFNGLIIDTSSDEHLLVSLPQETIAGWLPQLEELRVLCSNNTPTISKPRRWWASLVGKISHYGSICAHTDVFIHWHRLRSISAAFSPKIPSEDRVGIRSAWRANHEFSKDDVLFLLDRFGEACENAPFSVMYLSDSYVILAATDASTTAGGYLFCPRDCEVSASLWAWEKKFFSTDIQWLEALALLRLIDNFLVADSPVTLRVGVDNMDAIAAVRNKYSFNVLVNDTVIAILLAIKAKDLVLDLFYVKSEDNPADSLTRTEKEFGVPAAIAELDPDKKKFIDVNKLQAFRDSNLVSSRKRLALERN